MVFIWRYWKEKVEQARPSLVLPMYQTQISKNMNAVAQIMEPIATDTKRRNWVLGISTVGAIAGHLVSLYQQNVLNQPKPSVLGAIADKAEETLEDAGIETPDIVVNLVNYAFTAWLARMGGKKRAKDHPILPIAMGVKTVADATVAMEMARRDWDENKKIGTYSQVAAIAALASAAVALPEMWKGIQRVFKK